MSKEKTKAKKALRLIDIIGFAFSAVFVLDSFSAAAAIGWQSIIYWLILAAIFFIPYGLISAELGSTYTDGGIYTWVKRAFGSKWATRTNWFYWLNVGLWMSSVYLVFSSTLSAVFFPNHPISMWGQIGIAIAIVWVTVAFGLINMKYLKWIPNLSTLAKLIITLAIIAAAITWVAKGNPVSTSITDKDYGILPSWSTGVVFVPVIVYNLAGFELGSNAIENMKNPKRDIPLATLISGVTIIVCYIIGTICVNVIMDVSHLDISNGILQTFQQVFPDWLNKILAILLMFSLFGNMITWVSGSNMAIKESSENGEFPKLFASQLKNGSPLWATIIDGFISSILLIIAGSVSTGGEISEIFWQIYSFSSIVFLLPYLLIMPSFLVLRKKEKDISRPFMIKGNRFWQWVITLLPLVTLVACIILFLVGSEIAGEKTFAWNSGGSSIVFTLVGTLLSAAVGELLMWISRRKNKKSSQSDETKEITEKNETKVLKTTQNNEKINLEGVKSNE
jgi:amino acid transporter